MNKTFFTYSRKQQVKKLDENNNPIPVMRETGKLDETGKQIVEPISGQFEMEEITLKDGFNLNNILRVVGIDENKAIVVLNDGHEEVKRVQALINPAKPPVKNNIKEIKEAQWMVSEIPLSGEDLQRLYDLMKEN